MGRGAPKAQGNVWYEARLEAAKWNERLLSRFGAAEVMGLSEDAVKSAELGLYKSMPVDNAVLMADAYNAPELLNHYCLRECPIGREKPISAEVLGVDRVTIKLLKGLRSESMRSLKEKMLDIAEDGDVTPDELSDLTEIINQLDELSKTISEIKILGEKAVKGAKTK